MSMVKIDDETLMKLQKKYGFKFGKIEGSNYITIYKKSNPKYTQITFDEFVATLKKRKLAVYKSEKGDFLKIMANE